MFDWEDGEMKEKKSNPFVWASRTKKGKSGGKKEEKKKVRKILK